MLRLSLIILALLSTLLLFGQQTNKSDSPHGDKLQIDCKLCHTTQSWKLDLSSVIFSHDSTEFILEGQHRETDCKACHKSLVFNEAKPNCASCHTDMHNESLGFDCVRCHNAESWLLPQLEIARLHQEVAFPLDGVHFDVDCIKCHLSASLLEFPPMSFECASCHQADYDNTQDPNHESAGYSTNCAECHSDQSFDWSADNFDHAFFPLTGGHDVKDCKLCHENNIFEAIPTDCFSCHQSDFENSLNPKHDISNFPISCQDCHTTDPDWTPAEFLDHDFLFFPIYQGKHQGVWDDCLTCHNDPADFGVFSCTDCHEHRQSSMDGKHSDVDGYIYESKACYGCHPNGNSDQNFDHNTTLFPLTGAHKMADCTECHSNGYNGTPTTCVACHLPDFTETVNPDHEVLNFVQDCADCHTTDPEWAPASFDIHNDYYALNGAHNLIRNDCATCHDGNYTETPNTCIACHQIEYNNTVDPPHAILNFDNDCISCHTEEAWTPSTFEHDLEYFPIFSGAHLGTWEQCMDCHIQTDDYSIISCIDCHDHNIDKTNEEHAVTPGYSYNTPACIACHPTGNVDDIFDHNGTNFPLTGAHIDTDCISCHATGFENTPNQCIDCHTQDFDASLNPNHVELGLSTDCASCHTTDLEWKPATFDMHDDFYAMNGAHNLIRNDCNSCHGGEYIDTPNTCIGCHQADYDQTLDPNHSLLQFSNDCVSCHDETAWVPSTFDHDIMFFPVFSGKHQGEWDNCIDCHTDPNNYLVFTCTNCHAHIQADMDNDHEGINGYIYESNACLACHPNGDADDNFDHNSTGFSLTGAHNQTECIACHASGYSGTPNNCFACHESDYSSSINPNHTELGLEQNCETCHSTDPDWNPASFPIHSLVYPLTGGHQAVSNDCVSCHNGEYNNTPNTCIACHTENFNATTNPDHQALNLSTDCLACHTTDPDWNPAAFTVHNDFYVLEGAHVSLANDCVSCHNGEFNNTPNTCVACHTSDFNLTTAPDHQLLQFSSDCINCHTQDSWSPSTFDHDNSFFPIYSGKHANEWSSCTDCHNNTSNYMEFTCINCHTNPETDEDHNGIGGYLYENQACLVCHPSGDADDAFDHNGTNFPLSGAHLSTDCIQCHANGYAGTPTDCLACHQTDFDQTVNPDHADLGLSNDCVSCHTTEMGWTPASFNEHNIYFELTGAHIAIQNDCAGCHNGNYNNTPSTCAACHTTDYNATLNPNHQNLGISDACESCHTTDPGWTPAQFQNHDDYFALTGGHLIISNECIQCHNGDYNNTPNTCVACHISDYDATANPNHGVLGLSNDCASCHTTDPGWSPASFTIHDDYWTFTGAHIPISNDCTLCHNEDYSNTPNTCVACHQYDYNQSSNPDHNSLGFSNDCESCHTTDAGWSPANFSSHNDYWLLDGAHQGIANDCVICHGGDYTNTPNTCVGCHAPDYDQTSNPDHNSLGLSTDCIACHSTEPDWAPSSFDIHNDFYMLNGAHIAIANNCIECHNGNYNNTPNTCFGCHSTDYNNTNDPDHQLAQFPTDCITCHTESAWEPSTFDHDGMYFPIYSGKHDNEWTLCSECHTNSSNYTIFDCLGCHTNPQTNEDHNDVPNYSYDNNSCYSCHPDGDS